MTGPVYYLGSNHITGTAASEKLYGTAIDNSFDTSAGNDTLYGKEGDDTYSFSPGHGTDWIIDNSGTDRIVLGSAYSSSSLTYSRSGNNLVITQDADNKVIVSGWFSSDEKRIESIAFVNGDPSVSMTDILAKSGVAISGNSNDEVLNGTNTSDYILAGTGNDTLKGYSGDDTYYFNAGLANDLYIIESGGTDTINFGSGIDDGDISYQRDGYALYKNKSAKNDLLMVKGSHQIDLQKFFSKSKYGVESLVFNDDTDSLANNIATKGVTVVDLNNKNKLKGTSGDESILGGLGDDTIYGSDGNDTYVYRYDTSYSGPFLARDGKDVIYNSKQKDTLYIGVSDEKYLSYDRTGNDLIIALSHDKSGGGTIEDENNCSITLKNWFTSKDRVEKFELKNGSAYLSAADILYSFHSTQDSSPSTAEAVEGTDNADYFRAGGTNFSTTDTLEGGKGDDIYYVDSTEFNSVIIDNSGNDTLHFTGMASGYDLSKFDFERLNTNDLSIRSTGVPLLDVTVKDWFTSNSNRIENFIFDYSNTTLHIPDILDRLDFLGSDNADSFVGGNSGSGISGFGGNDTLYGMGGNDYIYGDDGTNCLYGGDGDDHYVIKVNLTGNVLDEKDSILDSSGNDYIHFDNAGGLSLPYTSDIQFYKNGQILEIFYKNHQLVSIEDYFAGADSKIESLIFADATITPSDVNLLVASTTQADIITGSHYDDKITGEQGNDTLYGYDGNDSYHMSYGGPDGVDYIYDSSGTDELYYATAYPYLTVDITKTGNDLTVNLLNNLGNATSASEIIKDYFANANNHIETIYNGNPLANVIDTAGLILGTTGNDSLLGGEENNTYFTHGGNDTIYDISGDDSYYITPGNSCINDYWNGNDTYYYIVGSGNDTISDKAGTDRIMISGVDPSDSSQITYTAVNTDLRITYTTSSGTDNLTLKDWFEGSQYQIDQFDYYHGTNGHDVITVDDINTKTHTVNGTINADSLDVAHSKIYNGNRDEYIISDAGNDTIQGYLGNDHVYDCAGNDYYEFAVNDGHDEIKDTLGNDTFEFTSGVANFNDLTFSRSNNDMVIAYGNSGNDDITVKDWFFSSYNQIEFIKIGSSTTSIKDIILTGSDSNDTLTGTSANEHFYGGDGNDTYSFNIGSGHDYIRDIDGDADKIKFKSGVKKSDIAFFKDTSNNLYIDYGTTVATDQITVINQNVNTIEKIQLSNGKYLDVDDINTIIATMASHALSHLSLTNILDVKSDTGVMAYIASQWHS